MSKQQDNTAAREAERAKRLAVARKKILDGSISAISIDTCIFDEKGNRLNDGVFKHLDQFKGNAFQLVFSEVTIKEVLSHISKDADEAKLKMVSALRRVGFYWTLESDHKSVAEKLLSGDSPKSVATKYVKDFVTRCGAVIVNAKQTVDLSVLLGRYFNVQAPFETNGEKKSEFPDAIALLSLEAWAAEIDTAVMFVTKDKGCKQFCNDSDRLFAVDDLTDALKLVQERNQHCINICRALESKIAEGFYPGLIGEIEDAIASDIDIDWDVEADSAFYYDAEIQDVVLLNAQFLNPTGQPAFRAVDYQVEKLVVQVEMAISVEATCNFSFSVRDGIDRDMVSLGDAEITKTYRTQVDVLLTFSELAKQVPDIIAIEFVSCRRTIDYGSVWPDYGDGNPNSEYY